MSDQSPANPGEASERELFLLVRNIACLIDTMGKNLRMLRHGLSELDSRVASNVPGATEALENMFKLWEQKCGQVVHDNPAGSVAAGAPAGSAAGGAAAGSAGAPAPAPPVSIPSVAAAAGKRSYQDITSDGGAADDFNAQRERARLKKNEQACARRAAEKEKQRREERLFVASARGWVPDHVDAASGAAESGAATGGAAGVRQVHVTVKLFQEIMDVSELLNTFVERDCKGDQSVTDLIAKSSHPKCKKPTSLFYNRRVYYEDSDGNKQPFAEQKPLSQVPSNNGHVILHVVVGPE